MQRIRGYSSSSSSPLDTFRIGVIRFAIIDSPSENSWQTNPYSRPDVY